MRDKEERFSINFNRVQSMTRRVEHNGHLINQMRKIEVTAEGDLVSDSGWIDTSIITNYAECMRPQKRSLLGRWIDRMLGL